MINCRSPGYFAWFALTLFVQPAIAADVSMLDTGNERVPARTVIPDYPKIARRDRIEGEVKVCFEVSRRGKPWRVAVRKSSHRVFEKPAVKAVRNSRFVPLLSDDEKPMTKSCRTFRFILEPVPEDQRD